MPVKFVSHVDEDKDQNWFIKLTDTLSNNSVICKDLDEYKIKLEEYSSEYGFDIEVVWTKSKSLSPKNYQDLNNQMALLQEEYKNEIDEINQK
ncbi:hypothetical protein [Halarcobacter anaerophilus]|uniref:Uncharacterized protein n=1 Tax=Halarcobacter anaerophilus TaxID=877500 RepID=A0A4Q0Y7C6_9BACT|nr:hypothetical protein [Halarcobacter anaerophilus]QDF29635.1 hypothetical protein AANAER_2169 [Halarcobacter anaerophilus]RXJ64869.1 hypothetical protein CRV06_02635 [Halarcobacter anaerophilus]